MKSPILWDEWLSVMSQSARDLAQGLLVVAKKSPKSPQEDLKSAKKPFVAAKTDAWA
jgi:hypothetical protein